MIGYVQWTEEKKENRAGETAILRMRFYRVSILRREGTPELLVRRRAAQAASRLQKLGVTRAVFPEDFPYGTIFARRGILPTETLSLYRSLASDWIWAEMKARSLAPTAAVAVSGERLGGELTRTVTELCLRVRYVLLDVPYGAEELARQLRREYGVSLLLSPTKQQLDSADVLVLFSPRQELSHKNPVVVPLYPGAQMDHPPRLRLPPMLEENVPQGCRREELFAALLETGALRPSQIEVVPSLLAP